MHANICCSGDGVIKIWFADTCAPASEVIMNGPVSTAGFLSFVGDIIIGFQKNLFYIQLRKGISKDKLSVRSRFVHCCHGHKLFGAKADA